MRHTTTYIRTYRVQLGATQPVFPFLIRVYRYVPMYMYIRSRSYVYVHMYVPYMYEYVLYIPI